MSKLFFENALLPDGWARDVAVTMVGGATVTLKGAPVGILPLRVARVLATGTTAADLVAVW